MNTSEIHARFGEAGLFVAKHPFERQSLTAEFKNILITDAKEFMAIISKFFQSSKFTYKGSEPTLEEYWSQRNKLNLYNRLLKLYFNKNLSVELAFIKAMALLESYGISIPNLKGRLSSLYLRVKEIRVEKMKELQEQYMEDAMQNLPIVRRVFTRITLFVMKLVFDMAKFFMRFGRRASKE